MGASRGERSTLIGSKALSLLAGRNDWVTRILRAGFIMPPAKPLTTLKQIVIEMKS